MWSEQVGSNIYNDSLVQHGAGFNQAIDTANSEGLGAEAGTDYDGLYATLIDIREESLQTLAQEDVDKMFVDAITAAAIEKRDPMLLDLLDRNVPGEEYTWAETTYGREQITATEDALAGMAESADDEAWETFTRERELAKQEATTAAIDYIINGQAVPEEVLRHGELGDPNFRITVMQMQQNVRNYNNGTAIAEDPREIAQLYTDILAGGGINAVNQAIVAGTINSPDTIREATSFANSLGGESAGVAGAALRGPTYDAIRQSIQARTTPDDMTEPWLADRADRLPDTPRPVGHREPERHPGPNPGSTADDR
jgi:hypothetical protein